MEIRSMKYKYLIISLIFFILALIQSVRWYHFGIFAVKAYLINFLPTALFLCIYLLNRKSEHRTWNAFLIFLAIISVIICGLMNFAVETIGRATTEVTNIKQYNKTLEAWQPTGLVEHFPRSIPKNAFGVRFSFMPGFLQGGSHIQLRMSMPSKEVSRLYDHFSKVKTKSFIGGDTNIHMNLEGGMPTTSFYTNDEKNYRFPEDFEIMIFDKLEDRRFWNHGQSHGIAISKKRNEIVYWAESW